MKNVSGGTQPLSAAMLAIGVTLAGLCAAEEPAAETFIERTSDKRCDQFNHSWVVHSHHTYLTIKVRVRWSAVGAKEMEEEILLSPGASRAIGCAAQLEILSAEILQF